MSHPQDLPLREQAAGVASGELDPHELLDATLARIEERDPELNSIVATFPDESRRMLDQAPPGPLHGVPVAIKDMFTLPWRGPRDGTPREQLPPGESGMFRLLRDAGAVVLGVTNMHFWGAGSTGHISAYGPVGNPWDVARCGGGSSGGSAAAVGARLVAAAVGTDGGGSVRLPAAYCGVTGVKGTHRNSPLDGYTHSFSSLGAAGPLCRDAADARLFGQVMYGRELPAGDGAGLRVAVVRDPFWDDLDPTVDAACSQALDATGWNVDEIALDGARHAQIATVLRLTLEGLPELTDEDLRDIDPLSSALIKYERLLPAEALVRADRIRAQLRRSAADAFERYDVLAWPTVPAAAPPIETTAVELPSGKHAADPVNVKQTGFGNLTGIPGVNVPVGLDAAGMPVGLQLQAAWGREEALLDAAEHVERATDRAHVDALPPLAAAAA